MKSQGNGTKTAYEPVRIPDMEKLFEENKVHITKAQRFYLKIKRIIDFVLSGVALVILSPVLLLVALAIKCSSPSEKVLFTQLRVGKNYKVFKLYKFRSMSSKAPKNMATCELENADSFITPIGNFIRKTSIDELPQLFNVFKGDMAIVGPRPLVYTEREIRFLRRYYGIYQIRPGVTGQAQVNGRDYASTYVKVAFDRYYLENFSPWMDMKMIFKTVLIVLKGSGVVEGAHATTEQEEKLLQAFSEQEMQRAERMRDVTA